MRFSWIVSLGLVCVAGEAHAQNRTAYQSGLRVAETRGYQNAECYARVFAKHAVVVEAPGGRRSWYAASTPAYNAEQRSRCGIDRLSDIAARREAARSGPATSRVAQRLGFKLASERGYRGADAICFARVYANFASPQPAPSGNVRYAIAGERWLSYSQELFRACKLSG